MKITCLRFSSESFYRATLDKNTLTSQDKVVVAFLLYEIFNGSLFTDAHTRDKKKMKKITASKTKKNQQVLGMLLS